MEDRTLRICDRTDTEIAANAITRAMLRGFVGIVINGEKIPVAFVSSEAVAAEIVERWNAESARLGQPERMSFHDEYMSERRQGRPSGSWPNDG